MCDHESFIVENMDLACALARTQLGLATASQLSDLGYSWHQFERMVETGMWRRLAPGLFASGSVDDTFERNVMAACLNSRGIASHQTAATLHGMRFARPRNLIEVTVAFTGNARSSLANVHRCRRFAEIEVVQIGPVPVTSVAHTLWDLGARMRTSRSARARYEHIVDDALDRKLVSLDQLSEHCHRYPKNSPRAAMLGSVIAERSEGRQVTESKFERAFLRACRERGLPAPATQVRFAWRANVFARSDVVFERQRVIVELDGQRGHTQLSHRELDLARDVEAEFHGFQTVRVSWRDFHRRQNLTFDRILRLL